MNVEINDSTNVLKMIIIIIIIMLEKKWVIKLKE